MQLEASDDEHSKWRHRYVLIVALICLVSWFASMWTWPLSGTDELRYSAVAQELVGRGNWLYLTYQGEAYDEKPPLAFWMTASLIELTGQPDNVWLLRLPGCFAALVTVLLTYLIGRDLVNVRVGFVAALLLICARLYNRQAMMVRLDMIYVMFTTLALWLWLRAVGAKRMSIPERIGFWLSLAAAYFTRNALVPAIVLAVIAIDCRRLRSWKNWRMLSPLIGGGGLIAFIACWLVLVSRLYPADVVENQLYEQILNRLSSTAAHAKPVWFYIGSILGDGFGPWGLCVPPVLIQLYRQRDMGDDRLRPLGIFVVGTFVLLSCVSTKRPEYLLAIYPAMAVFAATYLVRQPLTDRALHQWRIALSVVVWGTGVLIAGFGVIGFAAPQLLPERFLLLNTYNLAATVIAGLGFVAIGVATHRMRQSYHVLCGVLLYISLIYATYFHAFRAPFMRG